MNKYLLLLLAMIISLAGELLFKQGIMNTELKMNAISIVKTVFTPFIFFGFVLFGSGAIMWLFVLQRFPLSIAYPTLALNYVWMIIVSYYFFNEPITVNKIIGVFLIIAGVYFLHRSL